MIGKTSKTMVFLLFWMGTVNSFSYGENGASPSPAEAGKFTVSWRFVTNNYNNDAKFLASLTLVNKGRQIISKAGWKLYFSLRYHGINLQSTNPDFSINHVSGDLFYITPTHSFAGLKPGQLAKFEYTGRGVIANYQDVPSGFFLVEDRDNKPHPISLGHVDPGTLKGADAQDIFKQNKDITNIPVNQLPLILPSPVSFKKNQGNFLIDNQVEIVTNESFKKEADYISQEIESITGNQLSKTAKKKKIIFQKNTLPKEAYELTVTPENVTISASGGSGIFYGIQSLKNLMPASVWSGKHPSIVVPSVTIHDAPRFPVRAFMLGVSRNFQSKSEILKVLDVMALYKLNTFHFHFTDDEGWRIQIPGLPELTTVGSQRGYPFVRNQRLHPSYGSGPTTADKMGSGYYSRADFIGILKYAQTRHIRVIPEIESPGHARAAVRSMLARYQKHIILGDRHKAEEYLLTDLKDSSRYLSAQYFNDNVMNPALPSTYRFVEKVITEVVSMYKEAGADLTMIHMGGDEVPNGTWEGSPAIQKLMKMDTSIQDVNGVFHSYFSQINKMLNKRGLNLYAWEELAIGTQKNENSRHVVKIPDFVKGHVSVDAWYNVQGNESIPYEAANAGYKTMLTCLDFFYFDMSYRRSFYEPGDEWLGLLDVKKILSFIPYDYYRNATIDYAGNPFPAGYFKGKLPLTSAGKKNIAGIQGALWGENIRSSIQMEYMILPRLLALADKAWAKESQWELEADSAKSAGLYNEYWNSFANQLGKKELPKLSGYHNGYHFRIPAAGIKEVDGAVQANQQYPGLTIRYTTDGTEPKNTSPVYSRPVKLKGKIKMRVFDRKGRGSETTNLKNE